MPELPESSDTQFGDDVVPYGHPAGVVIPSVLLPPASPNEPPDESSVTVQLMPAWITVNIWPATVAVSVRDEGAGLDGIVTVTEPSPVPPGGVALRPLAVHAHDASEAVTVTDAMPPDDGAARLGGLMANEQAALEPNSVIV